MTIFVHQTNLFHPWRVYLNIKFIKILSTQVLQHSHKEEFSYRPQTFSQSGVVTIDEVLHAQQCSDVREGHQCWLRCVPAGISLLHKLRWFVL